MRRKVNNSEIHEIKRYYEVPSEKVQEWSDTIEELTRERDQLEKENKRKDKLIEALKASESNLWHSSREFEIENAELEKDLDYWVNEAFNDYDHTIATLFDERENLKQELHNIYKESEQLKIKNEYLLNVIKISENIEIHTDASEDD
ncbi:hypothetical protein [Staphylococcus phage VB-SauS-SA2]|nr:hypothetical protein [Staphylococcus phage VB-SauS-SA2]